MYIFRKFWKPFFKAYFNGKLIKVHTRLIRIFFRMLLFKCHWHMLEQLMTIFYSFFIPQPFFSLVINTLLLSLIIDKTTYDFMKILTSNCQGLSDYKKESDVLNYLYDKNYNIYFL